MRTELADIRACLEGAVPSVLASADAEGEPNVILVSQVDYVDASHLALSFQFFNKTRRNILANPEVQLMVVHPMTAAHYRIAARYLHTEYEGPLFARMKAKLAGIASHTGMSGVFKLLGADLYEVQDIERLDTPTISQAEPPPNRLAALRRASQALQACGELGTLIDRTLQCLSEEFGIEHGMLLLFDPTGRRLYTVGSLGYARAGVGSEVAMGEGVIGVAAQSRTAIRINHLTQDADYCRAIRERLCDEQSRAAIEREIAYPGLAEPHSQLALPVLFESELLGVLFVESGQQMAFDGDMEDALDLLCLQLATRLHRLQPDAEDTEPAAPAGARAGGPETLAPEAQAEPLPAAEPLPVATSAMRVRYFDSDCSVFLDDEYLIKGVAGAILWTLLNEYQASGRREFSNRELRLSPSLRLPDVNDNLEARLVLLQRRLAERRCDVQIEKTGRGRFRLSLRRPVHLSLVPR